MGSLRSGCATFIILTTENGELCRRRGRWANFKMMEVYVQECMALQYTTKKSQMTQGSTLFTWQELFRWRLTKSAIFRHAKIPENLWFFLFSRWEMTLSRTMGVESRRQLLWQHDNDLECVEGGAGQWQAPHTAPTIHHLQCHAALWATRKQLEGKIRDRLRWWQYLWLWATFSAQERPSPTLWCPPITGKLLLWQHEDNLEWLEGKMRDRLHWYIYI